MTKRNMSGDFSLLFYLFYPKQGCNLFAITKILCKITKNVCFKYKIENFESDILRPLISFYFNMKIIFSHNNDCEI